LLIEKKVYLCRKRENMGNYTYKQSEKVVLFDKETTILKLEKLGNPLEKLHKVIDFEMFSSELEGEYAQLQQKEQFGLQAVRCGADVQGNFAEAIL